MKINSYSNLQKNNSIVDLVSCVPEMTTKALTRNNIIHGLVENGMIDFENNRFPDLTRL